MEITGSLTDDIKIAPELSYMASLSFYMSKEVKEYHNYDTDKKTVNIEYVSGPFTTMYDYNGQTFSQQIANTTYGTNVKHKANIRNSTGEYINKKSENALKTSGLLSEH